MFIFAHQGIVVEMDRQSCATAFMVVRVHPMPLLFLSTSFFIASCFSAI
jgi:hypothetical protein